MEIHMQIKVMVGEDRFLYQPQEQTSGLLSKGRSFNLTQIILGSDRNIEVPGKVCV